MPILIPDPDKILIKAEASRSNVKDWQHLKARNLSLNNGDKFASTLLEMGANVRVADHFNAGDRVTALHQVFTTAGAYAKYVIAPAYATSKIPASVLSEEASTMPLVMLTAAITLFRRQSLRTPWAHATKAVPLFVYGASSVLSLFAIKLACLANIHPIVATGIGSSGDALLLLLDGELGNALVDYRNGTKKTIRDVATALKGQKARHALDTISAGGTWIPVSKMLDPESSRLLSVGSSASKYERKDMAEGVKVLYTYVGSVHSGTYLPRMPKRVAAEEVRVM